MASATAYLIFPMTDTEGDLVFSGVEGDGNPYGLLSMNEPPRPKRRTFADDSPNLAGSLATQVVAALTEMRALVRIEAASQAALETRKARMRAVVERLSFEAQQVVNGVTTTYQAIAADIAPEGDMDVNDLERYEASYLLTIPVQPLGA